MDSETSQQIYDELARAVDPKMETPSSPVTASSKVKHALARVAHSPWMCSGVCFASVFLLLLVFHPPIIMRREDMSISWIALFVWSLIASGGCFCLCKWM